MTSNCNTKIECPLKFEIPNSKFEIRFRKSEIIHRFLLQLFNLSFSIPGHDGPFPLICGNR